MELTKEEIESAIEKEIESTTKEYGKSIKYRLISLIGLVKMLQPEQQANEKEDELIPVTKWNEYYPDPSVGAMKMLVYYKDTNGFAEFGVVEKRGRKNLINARKYNEWRKAQNNK